MPDPQVQNKLEAVEQISSLLQGKPAETPKELPGSGDIAPTVAPAEKEPLADPGPDESELTPSSLAETLGLKPDEIYAKLRIPVDGGDAMTLSEFKDSGVELRGVRTAQNELAEQKVAHENSVMMQRQILQRAIGKVPPQYLTEDIIAEVQQEQQQYIETETRALHVIRPDLKDPAKWRSTNEHMVEHLTPYGFLPVEVAGLIDHRMLKYVIDNTEREQRLKKLDADGIQVTETPKLQAPSKEPAKPSRRAETKPATKRGPETLAHKAAKVAALLGAKK